MTESWLAALPCPAAYLGTPPCMNDALKALLSMDEVMRLSQTDSAGGQQIVLAGRRFVILRSQKDPRLLLFSEQYTADRPASESGALELRLRNPLSGASLAAQLLARSTVGQEGNRRYVAELRKNLAQLDRLSQNLYVSHLPQLTDVHLIDLASLVTDLVQRINQYLPASRQVALHTAPGETDLTASPALIEAMLLDLTVELLARGSRETSLSISLVPADRLTLLLRATSLGSFQAELEAMLFGEEGRHSGFEAARHVVMMHNGGMFAKKEDPDHAVITIALPRGNPSMQVYSSKKWDAPYDYVRTMLSDILERDVFMDPED